MADRYHVFQDASKECAACGRTFWRSEKPGISLGRFRDRVKYCSAACCGTGLSGDVRARYWANVRKAGDDDCWEWQGSMDPSGYGIHWYRGSYLRAHRYALELAGRPISDGEFALHSCDNRRCVNPAHLRGGTLADNARDRVLRGRSRHHIGQANHSSKLTDAAVREIKRSTLTARALARRFGVRAPCIRNVRSGRTWGHVDA